MVSLYFPAQKRDQGHPAVVNWYFPGLRNETGGTRQTEEEVLFSG